MKRKSFDKIIKDILHQEKVENIPLKNCNLIKQVIFDKNLHNTFYSKFRNNFVLDNDLFYSKVGDLFVI